jgi:Mg2+ and Co2+ transporter CorA
MDSKNNTKVLEALQMQPLSEEEKARRHILGRLWGPIATSKEKTRNGRGYNAQLWDKALKDEIFREKVANKSLFLELGHPVDREETDMNVVCACIPELPKVIDGDLYAYVDILDTKQGRLLKTLCDYGFIPGISSRGSGDVMANDEVDPETFFLETWDIVQLPAVKKARLTMCESLQNTKNLSKALRESLDQMSDEDRAEAEATLERLDVAVEDDDMYPDIPWAPGEAPLAEDTEEIEAVLDSNDIKVDKEANKAPDFTKEEPSAKDADAESQPEVKQTLKEETEETDDDSEEEDIERSETVTVGDFVDLFKDYDKDLKLEFDSIEVNEETITITELIFDDELEDGKVVVSFNYNLETSDNTEESENELETEESSPEDAEQPETEDASEKAIDDGDDEVIESLKEIVRQKDALEEEVLALKDQKAVSDAEVGRLSEELDKYKTGFMRVSELASKSTKLQKKVAALNEQLAEKNTVIRDLQTQAKTKLNESVDNSKRQLKELKERLITSQNEAEATEQALREQVDTARENARKATTAAKAYQQKYVAVVEHYIASKATMLGVSTQDITSKLNEGYTLEDVDRVCEKLLDAGRPVFTLGMGAQRTPQVRLKESAPKKQYSGGYDIDDDLLELAGLK